MSLRVVVTGSTGFVGRRVTDVLRGSGHTVVGIARGGGPGTHSVDVTDRAEVLSFFERQHGVAAVVHLAALAHQSRGASAADHDRVNRCGAENVIDGAVAAAIPRFVLLSTAAVYGDLRPEALLREDHAPSPIGAYAESKSRAEAYCLEHGPPTTVVLRPPAIYSAEWLLDVRKRVYPLGPRIPLRLVGPQPRYSLCALENIAGVVQSAVEGGLEAGVYNVADDRAYTQREVAETVASVDGVRRLLPFPAAVGRALTTLAGGVPTARGRRLRANLSKLFRGQVLDLSRIRAHGYVPDRRLFDLLRTSPRPRVPGTGHG